jgi:hypothetical protein
MAGESSHKESENVGQAEDDMSDKPTSTGGAPLAGKQNGITAGAPDLEWLDYRLLNKPAQQNRELAAVLFLAAALALAIV